MLNRFIFRGLGLILALITLIAGCREKRPARNIERSFYYWKSLFRLGQSDKVLLQDLNISRLYVKYFDVSWNGRTKQPMPMAIIKFPNATADFKELKIIPTVFITNDCIEKMDTSQVYSTAEKIFLLIKQICNSNNLPGTKEIQLDCDWNASTKNKYFALLRSMHHFTAAENKSLSATIRLYQCKYPGKTGIPPVDRGLLMCYNMGTLKSLSTHNSILEAAELKKYTTGISSYPLPLDVALPLFEWKVLFRNNIYRGLISELPTSSLLKNPAVKSSGNRYTISYDTTLGGYDLKAGDILRDEQVMFDEIIESVNDLSQRLKSEGFTVSLYHLDSLTLSKYSLHELETIFDHFR